MEFLQTPKRLYVAGTTWPPSLHPPTGMLADLLTPIKRTARLCSTWNHACLSDDSHLPLCQRSKQGYRGRGRNPSLGGNLLATEHLLRMRHSAATLFTKLSKNGVFSTHFPTGCFWMGTPFGNQAGYQRTGQHGGHKLCSHSWYY